MMNKTYYREFYNTIKDIAEHPVVKQMKRYPHHGNTSCYKHCLRVAYQNYVLCRKLRLDARSAARAGMLHDLFLYDWHTHARETGDHFHGFTHPRTALRNAREHFLLSKEEEEVILRHMWPLTPLPPMSGAGIAVVYADKLCSLTETALKVRGWFAVNFLYRRKFL